MHWYAGSIGGGFQGYTIGNILSAQFYAAALRAHPEISARDRRRASSPRCTAGCASSIYRHGRKFTPDELVERATGEPMSIEPYIAYLRTKYGELYRLG